ncbi:MAG: hypothetical protein O3C10_01815 [Chloroflexi bacterium]|nr:hypothetical protein [Chloroflexota bacterium]
MASLDMFLITTIGRALFGLIAALMLGFVGFLFWTVSFPPLSGLDTQTFTVVNTMALVVTIATGAAWFKFQAEWRIRLIALALIAIGAFAGGWFGYDYGFDRGIEELKSQYFGRIPGGAIRIPTQDGIRWSLLIGAVSANVMGLVYHVFRLVRYNDPGDY